MRNRFVFSIVLLSKEILQIFLGSVSFLTGGSDLSIFKSIISNDIKHHWIYRESYWHH